MNFLNSVYELLLLAFLYMGWNHPRTSSKHIVKWYASHIWWTFFHKHYSRVIAFIIIFFGVFAMFYSKP